jgi:biotin carboxylase
MLADALLPPLIVYVDTVAIDRSAGVLAGAAKRGMSLAVICPPASWSGTRRDVRVIETDDFSTASLRRIIADLRREFEVRGLCSSFGPFRPEGFVHEAVSIVAAELCLPHNPVDALYRATNKYLAREALAAAGIPNVAYALATDEPSLLAAARSIGYPVVLKPLTGVGSSLILRCENDRQAADAFRLAMDILPLAHYEQLRMAPHRARTLDGALTEFDPVRAVLVERYIEGPEASVECLVVGDHVVPLVVHDKILLEETPTICFEHLLVAPPERFSADEVEEMRNYAVQVVQAVGLRDLFCHVELRYTKDGPRLLEINPRLGAGCVRDSIETFTGMDVDVTEAALIVGDAELPAIAPQSSERHAMAFLFSPCAGVLTEFSGLRRVLRLPEVRAVRVGHRVGDPVGGDHEEVFLASIWMEAPNAERARVLYQHIRELVRIRVN